VSYSDQPAYTRWIVAVEILTVCVWGGGILLLANGLSGPFSIAQWTSMVGIWLGAPLAITAAFVAFGGNLVRRGRETVGRALVAFPLVLLAAAAVWAWFFG
jgi:hypothetical protein